MKYNYVENINGTITIDEIQGTGEILSIPSYINDRPVTSISVRACKIPALKELYIPKTITDIHGGAFYLCTNLEKIVVEKGNPVYDSRNNCNAIIETLSSKIIFGCKNTVIPKGIKYIGLSAFKDNTKLKAITIPDSIVKIKHAAFMGCTKLKEIHIPKSVKHIESYAFMGCENLSKVTFDPNIELQEIEIETFSSCSFKDIILPKSIKTIKAGAFEKCVKLEHIVLNDGLDMICEYAFNRCEKLKELIIPDSVTTIEHWICDKCNSLEKVHFGSGIEVYDPGTFRGCQNVDTFSFSNDFNFIADELMYTNNLKSILTPDNVCRFTSLVVLDYAYRNKRTDLVLDKYMDNMDEDEFEIFIERAIKAEWPEGANKYIEFYNKKFGGPNRLQI